MKKFVLAIAFLCIGAFFASCDLQPKITSLPDTVGDFISARYPAMLADPDTEPEIYNSAVSDYGVYASPELYGSVDMDEYVNYAGIDDYILKPEETTTEISDDSVDSDAAIADEPDIVAPDDKSKEQDAEVSDIINVPEYKNDELNVPQYARAGTIVVRRGDTLYALAREHNTTIENLAKQNKLEPPYTLRVGQVLKLEPDAPKAAQVAKQVETKPAVKTESKVVEKPKVETKPAAKTETVEKPKAESKPATVQKTKDVRVPLKTVTVAKGDTLYSLSRRYEIPVNDLAVMNGLSAPFALNVGQKLRVPDLPEAKVATIKPAPQPKATTNQKPVAKESPKSTDKPKTTGTKATPKSETKPAQKETVKQTTKPATNKSQPIAARSSSKFTWPVRGTILSHYGAKTGGLYNDGINISAALNTAVVAAENGVVAYAGNEVRGMGNLIIIQHAGGWMTVYAHLNSMSVRRGARVSVGQKIGAVGQTGKVTKPQLHFEIRKGTKSYNPVNYLKK